MTLYFIDSVQTLQQCLEQLCALGGDQRCLYVDLEGQNLSAKGSISLLTLFVEALQNAYIIDILTLGEEAFTTTTSGGQSLKSILESDSIIKVFFDVRNDSNALYFLFGIRLAGVEDLQLLELATREFSKEFVKGLAKCIERDAPMSVSKKLEWIEVKEKGRKILNADYGGDYKAFDKRPLPPDLMQYCVQDVSVLPVLREIYRVKMNDTWSVKVQEETLARIALSQTKTYDGEGRHMARGPKGWLRLIPKISDSAESRASKGEQVDGVFGYPHGNYNMAERLEQCRTPAEFKRAAELIGRGRPEQ